MVATAQSCSVSLHNMYRHCAHPINTFYLIETRSVAQLVINRSHNASSTTQTSGDTCCVRHIACLHIIRVTEWLACFVWVCTWDPVETHVRKCPKYSAACHKRQPTGPFGQTRWKGSMRVIVLETLNIGHGISHLRVWKGLYYITGHHDKAVTRKDPS